MRNAESSLAADIVEPIPPLPFPLEPRGLDGRRLCIVVPAFDEEASLPALHKSLRSVVDQIGVDTTILFVNDGSRDRSAAVLETICERDPRVGYVLLSRNFGHQAALTAGLNHADGDVVISMDADLQHPPGLIPSLLAAWCTGYDVVHTRKLATEGLGVMRRVVTRFAYRVIERLSRVRIIPQASDFRLMDRAALDVVRSLPEQTRLYRGLTVWIGFRQGVIPYAAAARLAGASRYDLRQLVQLFSRSLLDFSSVPLLLGLWVGGAALAVSVLAFVIVIGMRVAGGSLPSVWIVASFALMLLNALTLFVVGIIGAYVSRIYDEVRMRPAYVAGRYRPPSAQRSASRSL